MGLQKIDLLLVKESIKKIKTVLLAKRGILISLIWPFEANNFLFDIQLIRSFYYKKLTKIMMPCSLENIANTAKATYKIVEKTYVLFTSLIL